MLLVLLSGLGIYQDIVYEHNDRAFKHPSANSIHHIHKHFRSDGEPKRHHHVMTIMSPKHSLLHVFLPYLDLVISGSQIHPGKPRCTLQLIKKIIYPREWITVLHRELIQLPIVNEHPVRTVLLPEKKDRCSLG